MLYQIAYTKAVKFESLTKRTIEHGGFRAIIKDTPRPSFSAHFSAALILDFLFDGQVLFQIKDYASENIVTAFMQIAFFEFHKPSSSMFQIIMDSLESLFIKIEIFTNLAMGNVIGT